MLTTSQSQQLTHLASSIPKDAKGSEQALDSIDIAVNARPEG
jgi:hypothetical protein